LPSPNITAAVLDQFDLFVIIFEQDLFTQSERNAIFNWVNSRGGAVIAMEDSPQVAGISARFGLSHDGYYDINGINQMGSFVIDEPDHPIFNNVFGTVNSITNYDWVGHYNLPIPNNFTMIAHDSNNSEATIVSYNNGKAIFISDEGVIAALSSGSLITNQADILWGNLIAWAFFKN